MSRPIERMTVKQLKEQLDARNLSVSGLKADLMDRLREAEQNPDNVPQQNDVQEDSGEKASKKRKLEESKGGYDDSGAQVQEPESDPVTDDDIRQILNDLAPHEVVALTSDIIFNTSMSPREHMQQIYNRNQTNPEKCRIYVKGLNYQTEDEGLIDAFSTYGKVTKAEVIKDRTTRKSRGFGFVSFKTAKMAQQAVAQRTHVIDGRSTVCVTANAKQDRRAPSYSAAAPSPGAYRPPPRADSYGAPGRDARGGGAGGNRWGDRQDGYYGGASQPDYAAATGPTGGSAPGSSAYGGGAGGYTSYPPSGGGGGGGGATGGYQDAQSAYQAPPSYGGSQSSYGGASQPPPSSYTATRPPASTDYPPAQSTYQQPPQGSGGYQQSW